MNFKKFYLGNFTLQDIVESLSVLLEGTGFTIYDFKTEIPSDRNRKFLKLRQEEGKSGSYLKDVDWDEKKDYLTLFFESNPTYDKIVKTVSPNGKINDDSTFYTVMIRFEEVNKHLGSKKDFLSLKKKEQGEFVTEMIKNATVKIHSDALDFFYQGLWDNSDKLGFSILPFPKGKPRGKGIWSRKHKGEYPAIYSSKHLVEVVTAIPFLYQDIAKLIRNKEKN